VDFSCGADATVDAKVIYGPKAAAALAGMRCRSKRAEFAPIVLPAGPLEAAILTIERKIWSCSPIRSLCLELYNFDVCGRSRSRNKQSSTSNLNVGSDGKLDL
jgi:hypothetical protein